MKLIGVDVGGTHTEQHSPTLRHGMPNLRL